MFLLMVMYYKSFALSGIVLVGSFLSIIGVILGSIASTLVSLFYIPILMAKTEAICPKKRKKNKKK